MAEQEIPKIAERVKFWEEQDRINNALIPRVLKNHDLLVELSWQTGRNSETFSVLESRINEKMSRAANSLDAKIDELRKQLQDLRTQSDNLKSDHTKLARHVSEAISTVGAGLGKK
ncbi:MAG: hypothetical protein A2Z34_00665 [Planctomycetes bacterium RBG_16_59_8]|nr:MAG: hypothetical protein A2Z34_00665 [Planctomycetes bacterium RBG_16_59_8]